MKGRERPENRKHNRLRAGAPGPGDPCKSPILLWPGRARPACPDTQTGCAAARDVPRLMRSTTSAPTMHSPPEIIDAIV